MAVSALWCTWMSSEVELLQGALDLILLRALETMGPPARLQSRRPSRISVQVPPHADAGHAVSSARSPRAERLDQGQLAQEREQSRGEVLQHHQGWHARAREGNSAVATSCRICRRSSAQRAVAMATVRR